MTMRRLPFQRPTEHYDERLLELDEQLCALLKQRMDLSGRNPGFPPDERISEWADSYGLYEDFLKAVFGTLMNEEQFRPRVEPAGFRKQIPFAQSVEKDGCFYSVVTIRQYENASVVVFHSDRDAADDTSDGRPRHRHFELFAGEHYDCRNEGGGGSGEHFSYKFVIAPPLPDDLKGVELVFRESKRPFRSEPTGLEIVIGMGGES
jgi:hypothetical protein